MADIDHYAPFDRVRFLTLRTHTDARRSLTAVTGGQEIPFVIVQAYTLYACTPFVPLGGGHAHRELMQVIIPVAGSCRVTLYDGHSEIPTRLDDQTKGLYLPPMVWAEIGDCSPDFVGLVLASGPNREEEYIRSRQELVDWVVAQGPFYQGALHGERVH